MSIHTIHAALVRRTGSSFGSLVLASLIHSLYQTRHNLNCVPLKSTIAATISVYVIPGVSWIMRLLEGWTNRLNKYDLIYRMNCFYYRLLELIGQGRRKIYRVSNWRSEG